MSPSLAVESAPLDVLPGPWVRDGEDVLSVQCTTSNCLLLTLYVSHTDNKKIENRIKTILQNKFQVEFDVKILSVIRSIFIQS